MNFKKSICIFLLSFMLTGARGYAEEPQASSLPVPSSEPAVVAAPVMAPATGQWSDGWYQGADGYERAVAEYKLNNKPMVVYLSVTWCPYCRRFEKEVLSTPLVRSMLQGKIKVMIDPEAGSRENAIAFQYGIRGFPSFFLHPPQPGGAVQLPTGTSPEQFVEFFKQVLK